MAHLEVEITDSFREYLSLSYFKSYWTFGTVGVKQQQCVITIEDEVAFAVDVPIHEAKYILCEEVFDEWYIVLHSDVQGSCVVSVKDRKLLQHCEGTIEVFVDDYMNAGHEQVVFVFNNNNKHDNNDLNGNKNNHNIDKEEFFVTDFKCCFYDTRPGHNSTNVNNNNIDNNTNNNSNKKNSDITIDCETMTVAAACDGYKRAVASLSNKILSLTCKLHNEENKIIEKENLIEQCRHNLKCRSLSTDPIHKPFPGLVTLLGTDDNVTTTDKEKVSDLSCPFSVHEVWHKVNNGKIIVGVEVENIWGEELNNLSLRILSTDADIVSSSSKIHYPSRQRALCTVKEEGKTCKLQKRENDTNNGGVVDKQNCFRHSRRCHLLASLKYSSLQSLQLDLVVDFERTSSGKHFSVFIGHTDINGSDLLSDKWAVSDIFSQRDARSELAFEFSNHRKNFNLLSKQPNFDLPALVSNRLNCTHHIFGNTTVLTSKNLKCEMRFSESCRSSSSSTCYDCIVFASSSSLVDMVVDEVKKVVPPDVQWKTSNNQSEAAAKNLQHLLKEEINAGMRYLDSHLDDIPSDDDVIVLDSPKRKRSSRSESEEYCAEFLIAREKTDEYIISSQLFLRKMI